MRNKIAVQFSLFIIFCSTSFSQDVRDLVRFSETQVFGSARFEAMGGSFGALGADLSSAAINPAGFGRYSSSTFGLAFQNTSIKNTTKFNGNSTYNNLNVLRLNNLGFVISNDVSNRNRGFLFKQFGFSYNRIQNFKDSYSYSGQQFNSLLDNFAAIADQTTPEDLYSYYAFSTALAWDTYAIDQNVSGGYVPRLNPTTDVIHRRNITNSGGISEYNFTFSGNYLNTLYVGGNIGLRTAKYEEQYIHFEEATNSQGLSLDSFQYQYNLETKGNGTNIKLGAIYLPTQNVRIGLALHSPTFYEFTDTYSADMISYHKDTTHTIPSQLKPQGDYKYRLRNPLKLILSLAYVFQTRGCINTDIEIINYKWAHLRTTKDLKYTPFDYSPINEEAKPQLRTIINYRIGGEIVFNSQYFLRGGFAYYPSAYNKKINPTKGIQIFTAGAGIKWKNSSFDFALKIENRNYNYYAFNESLTTVRSIRNALIFNYSLNF
jgi:hypothetical protein